MSMNYYLIIGHACDEESEWQFTNSEKAKLILDDWDNHRPKFIKVMPTEYRRALEEIKAEQNANVFAAE